MTLDSAHGSVSCPSPPLSPLFRREWSSNINIRDDAVHDIAGGRRIFDADERRFDFRAAEKLSTFTDLTRVVISPNGFLLTVFSLTFKTVTAGMTAIFFNDVAAMMDFFLCAKPAKYIEQTTNRCTTTPKGLITDDMPIQ
uniref:Uncharacterized protein n=1 Tax=Romanomermis culicivorax TaxID=13658 RepID=A0A915HH04_ROMCU